MSPRRTEPEPGCPPDLSLGLPEGPASTETLAHLAKALGHPARITILKTLLAKEGCVVGELAHDLPLAASTISQHLKVLKASGLIKGSIDGPRRCYCVDGSVLGQLKSLVEAL